MTEHVTFIRQCIELAAQAVRQGDEPFGALLAVDNEVLLTARNLVATESDQTRHAELVLTSEACRRFSTEKLARSTLYASTEPCAMCCGAIYWAPISRVVYGCSAVALGSLTHGSLVIPSRQLFSRGRRRVEVLGPVLEAEALAVHRSYWSDSLQCES